MGDLEKGAGKWDTDRRQEVSLKKNIARDAAFILVYLIVVQEIKDIYRAFNAVVFLVSHCKTFSFKTRKMVRKAFKYKFSVSVKQRKILDK